MSRVSTALAVALVTTSSLGACDRSAPTAGPASAPSAQTAVAISPAQAVLTDVWRAANPEVAPPALSRMIADFDPELKSISRAEPQDAHAFVVATAALAAALQHGSPAACVALPRADFTPETLAALPESALPAFRSMLTARLATVAAGKARTNQILPAFSGSMQTLSNDLTARNAAALDTLAVVGSHGTYDPVAACQATVDGWRTLETTPQAPLLIDMLYSTGDYAPG